MKTLPIEMVQRMNRHDRRKLGKINNVKIIGTNVPHKKDDRK